MHINIGIECPNCGYDIIKRCESCTEKGIVSLSLFSNEIWECECCGCVLSTPDEKDMYEIDEEGYDFLYDDNDDFDYEDNYEENEGE